VIADESQLVTGIFPTHRVFTPDACDVMISRRGDSDDVIGDVVIDGEDFSDVMAGGNVSDIVAVWGFLVEDANWTEYSATTDGGGVATSAGDSDQESVVWRPVNE